MPDEAARAGPSGASVAPAQLGAVAGRDRAGDDGAGAGRAEHGGRSAGLVGGTAPDDRAAADAGGGAGPSAGVITGARGCSR